MCNSGEKCETGLSGSCHFLQTQICEPEASSHDMAPLDEVSGLERAVRDEESLRAACKAVAARTSFTVSSLVSSYRCRRGDPGHLQGTALLTADQDAILLGVTQAFSAFNFPLSLL